MLFVTKKQYDRDIGRLRDQTNELRAIVVEAVGVKRYQEIIAKMDEPLDTILDEPTDTSAGNFLNESDQPPVDDSGDKTKLPPRSEYDERVKSAIDKFRAGKNVSTVMVELHIAKKTARRYLKIALAKRKVKKSDFDDLNV